jgi:hypothetical protein
VKDAVVRTVKGGEILHGARKSESESDLALFPFLAVRLARDLASTGPCSVFFATTYSNTTKAVSHAMVSPFLDQI